MNAPHFIGIWTYLVDFHQISYHIDGKFPFERRSSLSCVSWKHSGRPVSLQLSPRISLTTPGAHVKIRAIPVRSQLSSLG